MKKCWIFYLLIILFLEIGCLSYKAPQGVSQPFYNDMIKCIQLTEKTLETKNTKYIKEIEKLIIKHTSEDVFEIILGLKSETEESKNDYGLSKKESDILSSVFGLSFFLTQYMNDYYNNSNYNIDKLIDTNTVSGRTLLKTIQKTISIMELDYEFKN